MNSSAKVKSSSSSASWIQGISEHRREPELRDLSSSEFSVITKEELNIEMRTQAESTVKRININMPCQLGFHLRVVARFVKCMYEFRSNIRFRKGETLANGKSILELLSLGAGWKSNLEIEAIGEDAVEAIEGIKQFFLNPDNIVENCS